MVLLLGTRRRSHQQNERARAGSQRRAPKWDGRVMSRSCDPFFYATGPPIKTG